MLSTASRVASSGYLQLLSIVITVYPGSYPTSPRNLILALDMRRTGRKGGGSQGRIGVYHRQTIHWSNNNHVSEDESSGEEEAAGGAARVVRYECVQKLQVDVSK